MEWDLRFLLGLAQISRDGMSFSGVLVFFPCFKASDSPLSFMRGLGIRYENETCGNNKRQEAPVSEGIAVLRVPRF